MADGSPAPEAAAFGSWFHNLHLPDGTRTAPDHPLGDFPRNKWMQMRDFLPHDLTGCTVLDVGCNAGFYSIKLAQRGARVSALDVDPHFLRQAQWASRQFGLEHRITLYHGQVYDLARWRQRFDFVLFLGVFYHLRYPLLALDLLAQLVQGTLVFQTLSMPGDSALDTPDDLPLEQRDAFTRPGWPRMAFIEKACAGDPTNWWAPDQAAIEAMLRSAGFDITGRPGHEIYVCLPHARGRDGGRGHPRELAAATGTSPGGISRYGEPAAPAHQPGDDHAPATAPPSG